MEAKGSTICQKLNGKQHLQNQLFRIKPSLAHRILILIPSLTISTIRMNAKDHVFKWLIIFCLRLRQTNIIHIKFSVYNDYGLQCMNNGTVIHSNMCPEVYRTMSWSTDDAQTQEYFWYLCYLFIRQEKERSEYILMQNIFDPLLINRLPRQEI